MAETHHLREAQIGVRLTAEQRRKLEKLASATGSTLSAVVATLIDQAAVRPTVTLDPGTAYSARGREFA